MSAGNEPGLFDNILGTLLSIFFPLKMLLRTYSLCILMFDLSWVMVNAMCAIVQAVFELFKPPPRKSIRLEIALVVGAGRGLGREIAMQVAALGAVVLCLDKNKAFNDETVQMIKDSGGSAAGYTCDVVNQEETEETVAKIKKDVNFVSMLFYCCGIPSPRSFLMKPAPNLQETLDLSLTSYFRLIDQFISEMKNNNHGHIVALTSMAGLSQVKDQMPLSVAQFAVQGLASSLMEDLRINKVEGVYVTLVHIYPFVVDKDSPEFRLRIPSYFGTISSREAARSVLDSVRRNYPDASVPNHLLYLGHLLRVLPRKATVLIRDLLDTGVDFA